MWRYMKEYSYKKEWVCVLLIILCYFEGGKVIFDFNVVFLVEDFFISFWISFIVFIKKYFFIIYN